MMGNDLEWKGRNKLEAGSKEHSWELCSGLNEVCSLCTGVVRHGVKRQNLGFELRASNEWALDIF